MKFYVIEISTGDKSIAGKAIYEYDDEIIAMGGMHKKMGIAMNSELYSSEILIVINQYGNVIRREYFERNKKIHDIEEDDNTTSN